MAKKPTPSKTARRTLIGAISPVDLGLLRLATTLRSDDDSRTVLLKVIRAGAPLPDDLEDRRWLADMLEGKHQPKRGRGRSAKRVNVSAWIKAIEARRDRSAVEKAIAEQQSAGASQ